MFFNTCLRKTLQPKNDTLIISELGLAFGVLFSAMIVLSQTKAVALVPTPTQNFFAMERELEQDFEGYFGKNLGEVTQAPSDIVQTLNRLAKETGSRAGIIWVIPREDHLHLVLITPDGGSIVKDLYDVPRSLLLETTKTFQAEMLDHSVNPKGSRAARLLHTWIIESFESEYLKPARLDALLFCLGNGLRGLPIAALQDDTHYLIEKYSITSIPGFNLIDTRYQPFKPDLILAAGASQFKRLSPLPAVPTELKIIQAELQNASEAKGQWQGRSLLNQTFTLKNFKSELKHNSFRIVHLATHAEFKPGKPNQSFIQFSDQPLSLEAMDKIRWPQTMDLLVLSACKTAIGDPTAELGFAGVALKSNIKSAIGSLWDVSDVGTLALMQELYRQLPQSPTKAHALQKAQLQLLYGKTQVTNDRPRSARSLILRPEAIATESDSVTDFSHPFFWAGFTMLSSPW